MSEKSISRRSFVGRLLKGTLLAGFAGFLGGVIAYVFPSGMVTAELGPRGLRVGKPEDIPLGKGKLTLVNDVPVWLVHLASGFVAVSAFCTHKGCMVDWKPASGTFGCPCHEGSFDKRGNVLAGLPRRPLTRYRVGIVGGEIFVSEA